MAKVAINKTNLQKKLGTKYKVRSLTKNGSTWWVEFYIKGELGYANTSGRTMTELVRNIKAVK